MSLSSFHIVFIALSAVMSAFCGVWAWQQYQAQADGAFLAGAIGGCVGALLLVAYGWRRFRKLHRLNAHPVTFSVN